MKNFENDKDEVCLECSTSELCGCNYSFDPDDETFEPNNNDVTETDDEQDDDDYDYWSDSYDCGCCGCTCSDDDWDDYYWNDYLDD